MRAVATGWTAVPQRAGNVVGASTYPRGCTAADVVTAYARITNHDNHNLEIKIIAFHTATNYYPQCPFTEFRGNSKHRSKLLSGHHSMLHQGRWDVAKRNERMIRWPKTWARPCRADS
jgi:hypothetical protein